MILAPDNAPEALAEQSVLHATLARMLLQKRIHQWSEQRPAWQRDLLRRLASGPLSDQEQGDVIAILTDGGDAPAPRPLELADLPVDEDEVGPVELREISDLQNINLLAGGQTLAFAPGINVVFGLTGAGKSGYGRLLRRICRSAETSEVLPDVFDPGFANAPQTASLKIAAGGESRDIAVDLADDPDRILSAMAAFDAGCARVYLSGPNTIGHVPRPLRLLARLARAQDDLGHRLDERADALRSALPPLPDIDPATPAGRLVESVTATTDLAKVAFLATLTNDELGEVKKLDIAAATIKSDQGHQLEAAARARARGAASARNALRGAADQLTDERLEVIGDLRTRLEDATEAERKLASETFSGQRFPETGQGAWREMWEAARRFAESGGRSFPDTGPDAACPTCQQDLDEDARERMRRFEQFVRSDLRGQIATLNADLSRERAALPDVDTVRMTVEAALSQAPDAISVLADSALTAFSSRADVARRRADGTGRELSTPPRRADIDRFTAYAEAQNATANAQAALRDEAEQRRIMDRLAELRGREDLAAAIPAIRTRVEGLREIARVEAAKAKLGTKAISDQLRELQRAVITDRLRTAVAKELQALHPAAGKVEVVGHAAKGATVVQLRFRDPCRAKIGDVLSDGEQRGLALAFFLAEVAVSDGRSAIILDDPVSSLDLERRDYVAKRLVEEARRRQVVVFTHDLTFVYMLQEAAETAGQELHSQTLQRAFQQVGVVSDELPDKALSPSRRRKNLRNRLRTKLKPMYEAEDPDYEREADVLVTDLRKGYDQLIEEYLLAGVVRRLHSQVRVHRLHHVKLSMDLVKRIETAIKKASNKAHHEAAEMQPRPYDLSELSEMLDEYDAVCEDTHPERKGAVTLPINGARTDADAELKAS
jgi:ABC-type multidrug transport system ATPase subunit